VEEAVILVQSVCAAGRTAEHVGNICTAVPDEYKARIWGIIELNVDFRIPCRLHDICYGSWWSLRRVCDQKLFIRMKWACDKQTSGNAHDVCYRIARLYRYGVWQLGGRSWIIKALRDDRRGATGCPFYGKFHRGPHRREACIRWVQSRSYPRRFASRPS
jgi:hypothetical protein